MNGYLELELLRGQQFGMTPISDPNVAQFRYSPGCLGYYIYFSTWIETTKISDMLALPPTQDAIHHQEK